jgi:hypothetical protein
MRFTQPVAVTSDLRGLRLSCFGPGKAQTLSKSCGLRAARLRASAPKGTQTSKESVSKLGFPQFFAL